MKYYYTQSLNMAAWLKSCGFEIREIERSKTEATFYFDKTDEVHNAVREYNSNLVLKNFIYAFKEIKQLIKVN